MKVYKFEDENRTWHFSEQWLVRFEEKEGEFWKRKQQLYCTRNKNSSNIVEKQFNKDFPKAHLISIRYQ